MKKWLIGSVLLILAVIALMFLLSGRKKADDGIRLVKVKRGDIAERALAVGTIEPEKEIKVKSTIPGIVAEVYFKVGDPVAAGKPLLKISPNPTPIEYVETQRNMEVFEVLRNNLRSERERQVKMFKDNLISASAMEAVESKYNEAELRYRVARERFELLEKGRITMSNREINSIIKAPISGIVLSQSVFQGDPIVPLTNYQPGTEICSLADMGKLLFKGTIDEIDVGKIEPQMKAEIQIGALRDTRVEGRLDRVYPKAKKEGNATLFDIEIIITKVTGKSLRAGYSASAYLSVRERKNVLILPERLVLFENGKKYAEFREKETIEKKEIETGLSDGLNVEILKGLGEGEEVVERPPREIK